MIAVGVAGLVAGLFVDVLIVRVPAGESVTRPGSRCPHCRARVGARDNVSMVSWLARRGRCRSCGGAIHWGYPVVEVLNAVLWGLAAWRFGARWQLVPYLLFFSVLLALSVIDLKISRLPDKLTFPSTATSLVLIPVAALLMGTYGEHGHRFTPGHAVVAAFIGGVAYFGLLFIPAWVYPRGMGFGDVKLAGLMGLYLGWISPTYIPVLVILSLVIASVIGLVVGLGVLVARGGKSKPYPFGPWLALGCILAIVGSDQLLGFYGI